MVSERTFIGFVQKFTLTFRTLTILSKVALHVKLQTKTQNQGLIIQISIFLNLSPDVRF